MRTFIHIVILTLFTLVSSCSKPDETETNSSFIKMIDAEGDYLVRNSIQLDDGSIVIFSTGLENKLDAATYGNTPSIITKYSPNNKVVWQKEISNAVYKLWKGIKLANGNLFVCGFDSQIDSEKVGLLVLNEEGEELYETSFINQASSSFITGTQASIDALQLPNGNIAVLLTVISGANQPLTPRLMILDTQLNIIDNIVYAPGAFILNRSTFQHTFELDNYGNLFIIARCKNFTNDQTFYGPVIYKLSANDYLPEFRKLYTGETRFSPSNIAVSQAGNPVWAETGPKLSDSLFTSFFNLGDQEGFFIGDQIKVNELNVQNNELTTKVISGYPNYGFIKSIKKCTDGGFILIGACNITANLNVTSDFKLLLVKLDANLSQEWIRTPETFTSTVGWDVEETDYGYLVSATHINFSRNNQAYVIYFNKNGQLKN